jgi:ABC-type sugar transport system ATPase subunit
METLAVAGIGKSYDCNVALHDVSFQVPKGTILAICGENGAGKSTLMKILSGATGPDQGEIRIDGNPVRLADPHDAIARGIHIVHQELSLLPHLSVAENMLLGKAPHRSTRWVIDWAETNRIAESVLLDLGFDHIDVRLRVAELSVSVQQIVEIAKALVGEPQVLILDEPTAVLSLHETELLFRTVRRLAAAGTIVIYISHRLEEVFQIAHRVLVLKDGARVIESDIAVLDNDGMIRAMVGRPLAAIYPKRRDPVGDPILQCRGLTLAGIFNDIGFDIRSGEIVGMFGLVGSGRTDVAKALFGAAPADSGEIRIGGHAVSIASPRDAMRHGIALVTEDRKRDGLALDLSVIENGGLASMGSVSRLGVLDRAGQARVVGRKLDELAVRPQGGTRPARQLSGGNQQKVVLAKWLLVDSARIFIFDEPTRGVDIATKVEIYRMMAELAAAGMGILLISSELPEVTGMSDRLLVMRAGRLVAELPRSDFSMEAIFAHAADVAGGPTDA